LAQGKIEYIVYQKKKTTLTFICWTNATRQSKLVGSSVITVNVKLKEKHDVFYLYSASPWYLMGDT